jgi:hypothetical protein
VKANLINRSAQIVYSTTEDIVVVGQEYEEDFVVVSIFC